MNYHDLMLEESEFVTIAAPFQVYCANSKCNTYIRPGEPVKRFTASTFTHVVCPSTPRVTMSAHRQLGL